MISYIYAKILKRMRGSSIKGSKIHRTAKIESGCNVINSTMERHSFCGYNCEIFNCDIGPFTSIANGVVIGGGAHPMNWVSMSPVFYEGRDSVQAKFSRHMRPEIQPVIVGADVWIGQNVLIKQGVSIGVGAVVGMGSVVTRDVEAYSIVAGSPARKIGDRFDQSIVEKLLLSEWWIHEDSVLKRIADHIQDPETFLKELD